MRPKKYSKLSATKKIQADCDVNATNIILQGLPPEVYALVSNHKVAKELWERIQLLMQGTSLTKHERECKLYDEFDKFAYKKGETLRDFYLIFSLLLNDMNIYNMRLEQFQVNTKFLSTLPPKWSKFLIDVKLVRDLHTTNIDQLHAYLGQHKFHANEVRLIHECNSDPLTLVATHYMTQQTSLATCTLRTYTQGASGNNSRKQKTVICCNYKGEGDMSKQCTKPKRKQDDSWFKDKVLLESLMKTVTLRKNDFKKEESRNIDRKIALEQRIKRLDNIVFKRVQSAQTIHMLTKLQFFYDHTTKQALETLMLAGESRSKMLLKQKDPMMLQKKVNTTRVDYVVLNRLSQDFDTRFVPQTESSAEQAFWS
uniref:Integrase, catalytic region, zinc finger, CCHC-type, peptidase aspartic, catalytic n=1 Tax=Tanacetum cinerariifolium TaxID=118510 RepID=A0A6L2M258_TANCI|nr:hypothetical protein [Tanacetum cinerariifolium]